MHKSKFLALQEQPRQALRNFKKMKMNFTVALELHILHRF